jgi:hypothetical protein
MRRKPCLKDRLQHPKHCLLDDSVPDRRYPQRPLTPIRLGNQHSLDRERTIRACPKFRDQLAEILFESLAEFFHADPIDSGCPMVSTYLFISGSKPPRLQYLPHQAMDFSPLLHHRA